MQGTARGVDQGVCTGKPTGMFSVRNVPGMTRRSLPNGTQQQLTLRYMRYQYKMHRA
jgi:hypothetical protein